MLAWLLGCTDAGTDTALPPDETGGPLVEVDADGDGYPAWDTTTDAARADCDDADPAVTPDTERYVPAGPFTRGDDELMWASPVRTITISAFCIDGFEVTNAAFVDLLQEREDAGHSNVDDDGNLLYNLEDLEHPDDVPARIAYDAGTWSMAEGYEDHPVVEVYRWSAEFFCAAHGKSLPTEAQWEKAARGPDDARTWPWGDDAATCDRANYVYRDRSVDPPVAAPCVLDTVSVGSYPQGVSPYDAWEMGGNVAEWVADWFDPDAYATDPDTDPAGPDEGMTVDDGVGEFVARTSRGGSYLMTELGIAVAARTPEPWDGSSNGVGFRCARPLE